MKRGGPKWFVSDRQTDSDDFSCNQDDGNENDDDDDDGIQVIRLPFCYTQTSPVDLTPLLLALLFTMTPWTRSVFCLSTALAKEDFTLKKQRDSIILWDEQKTLMAYA